MENISNTPKQLQNTIKATLAQAGFKDVYANKNGALIVKGTNGDAVKVQIELHSTGINEVQGKFPQIGNGVQVICTLIILVIGFSGYLPWPFISAIVIGQLISFIWFQPKIKQLKGAVESVLAASNDNLL
ncbi:MAG: hypothetical protein ACRBFS_03755 [Aureispira sp.]